MANAILSKAQEHDAARRKELYAAMQACVQNGVARAFGGRR